MKHIVLLGDSILDNGPYLDGAPDVAAHLRALRPEATVDRRAVDGAVTADVLQQLAGLPDDTLGTVLVLSAGGNDALKVLRVLLNGTVDLDPTQTVRLLGSNVGRFAAAYRALVARLQAQYRLLLSTIYDCDFDPDLAVVARTVIALYNDAIVRTAHEMKLPVLELRTVLTEPRDYVQQIEPSTQGGRKIAEAIAEACA